MIRVTLALFALFLLSACSPPQLELTRFDDPRVSQVSPLTFAGKNAAQVVNENHALSIPNDFKQITLPKPEGGERVSYGIVPWKAYQYHEKHKSLGDLRGANMTDLVAFQASYGHDPQTRSYLRICAPVGRLRSGQVEMMVLSRGTDFGLYYQSCEWALVVLPESGQASSRVL